MNNAILKYRGTSYPVKELDKAAYTVKYEREDGEVFFRTELEGEFTVKDKKVYDILYEISIDQAGAEAVLTIGCPAFKGIIRRKNIKVEPSKCVARFKVDPLDDYTCILKGQDERVNFFDCPSVLTRFDGQPFDRVEVSSFTTWQINSGSGVPPSPYPTDRQLYSVNDEILLDAIPNTGNSEGYYFEMGDPDPPTVPDERFVSPRYCIKSPTTLELLPGSGPTYGYLITTEWWRDERLVPAGDPAPAGWEFASTDGSNDKYWRCPVATCDNQVDFPFGRRLEDVLLKFVEGCNVKSIQSHFFSIGTPDYPLPTNKEYQDRELYAHLTIHQRGDINDPNASNPATAPSYEAPFEEFFDDLRLLYNVGWDIRNGVMTIEHVSFFDTSSGSLVLPVIGEITAEEEKIPSAEKWTWPNLIGGAYFSEGQVTYDQSTTDEPTDYGLRLLTADICAILNSDSSASKSGFVIIANQLEDDGSLSVIDGNSPNAFPQLLYRFHRYGLALDKATINGTEYQIDSPKPFRKTESFRDLKKCERIDTNVRIKTKYGQGRIETVTHDPLNCRATYEVLLEGRGFTRFDQCIDRPTSNADIEVANSFNYLSGFAKGFRTPGGVTRIKSVDVAFVLNSPHPLITVKLHNTQNPADITAGLSVVAASSFTYQQNITEIPLSFDVEPNSLYTLTFENVDPTSLDVSYIASLNLGDRPFFYRAGAQSNYVGLATSSIGLCYE